MRTHTEFSPAKCTLTMRTCTDLVQRAAADLALVGVDEVVVGVDLPARTWPPTCAGASMSARMS
jgi:hypothetical protein